MSMDCMCQCHNPKLGGYHGQGVIPCCNQPDVKPEINGSEEWEKELIGIINNKHSGLGLCDNMYMTTILPFIRELLAKERERTLQSVRLEKNGIGDDHDFWVEYFNIELKKKIEGLKD